MSSVAEHTNACTPAATIATAGDHRAGPLCCVCDQRIPNALIAVIVGPGPTPPEPICERLALAAESRHRS